MYRPGLSRRAVYPAVYQRRCHPGGPLRRCAEADSRSPQGGSQPQSNPHHRQRQGLLEVPELRKAMERNRELEVRIVDAYTKN